MNWFRVLSKTDTDLEILLYEEIGGWGVQPSELIDQLKESSQKYVTLRINSPGGDLFGGISIYNYLRKMEEKDGRKVKTIVDGVAASAASLVFLGGSEGMREMATGTSLMVHDPLWFVGGNADDLERAAKTLRGFGELAIDIYEERTGMDREKIRQLMANETWINAHDALAMGFASNVASREAVAACAGLARLGFSAPKGMAIEPTEDAPEQKNTNKDKVMLKQIHEKFNGKPDMIAAAIALAATNEALTFDQVSEQVETDAREAELQKLMQVNAELTKKVTELETANKELTAKVEAKAVLGAPPVPGAPAGGDNPDGPKNVLEEYNAIEDKDEKLEFYAKHKAAILRLAERK